MGKAIRIQLLELGKKQKDLIPEIRKRGYSMEPSELSAMLSGTRQGPKAEVVHKLINEIIGEWKAEME